MSVFDILILLAVAAVAVTLFYGLYTLYRGSDLARSRSNKIMRLRVLLQAVAVVLLLIGFWWKSTHGA
jgi:uncharacterized membrane protein